MLVNQKETGASSLSTEAKNALNNNQKDALKSDKDPLLGAYNKYQDYINSDGEMDVPDDPVSANSSGVSVGDIVQIRNGGMDVTNGIKAKSGFMYGEGGPLTCKVVLIDENWYTGGNFGLPQHVIKVRCSADNGVVVWQVRPEDIIVKVSSSKPPQTKPSPAPTSTPSTTPPVSGDSSPYVPHTHERPLLSSNPVGNSLKPYAIAQGATDWTSTYEKNGNTFNQPATETIMSGTKPTSTSFKTDVGTRLGNTLGNASIRKNKSSNGDWRELNRKEKKSIGNPDGLLIDDAAIKDIDFDTAFDDSDKRRVLLMNNSSDIQNQSGYPVKQTNGTVTRGIDGSKLQTARYDYKVLIGDNRIKQPTGMSLKDQLTQIRATFGIPVHGRDAIARAMKYYMYNRFKSPDSNLAYNKTFTYIFFTRPDLYLLDAPTASGRSPTVCRQVNGHTDGSWSWLRYPELFKLLTDRTRCGDNNNFNMLLSNQVCDFDIRDESLSTFDAGKSWRNFSIVYGDIYTGREAGEFNCTFTETSNLAVYNLIRIWMTYVDNVARGAWSPSYDLMNRNKVGPNSNINAVSHTSLNDSHVYTKTLDYASSVYVFKCGPDGEDILYWTKYYGIFPTGTGSSALSVTEGKSPGDPLKITIPFRYSYKRDMSPVSLIEFNRAANVEDVNAAQIESSYHTEFGHSVRPFVGVPFIEINHNDPVIEPNGVKRNEKRTQIRLKFKKATKLDTGISSDDEMFAAPSD